MIRILTNKHETFRLSSQKSMSKLGSSDPKAYEKLTLKHNYEQNLNLTMMCASLLLMISPHQF